MSEDTSTIGLIDTMEDLIVNFIGAAVFSVIGFFYVRSRGKNTVLGRFIPRRKHGRDDRGLEQSGERTGRG